jgi:MscS family membrane protein
MGKINILDHTFLGNTIENYLWFFGILFAGIVLKKFLTKLFTRCVFEVFKRYGKTVGVETFLKLMNRPLQFFIMILIVYMAFNRLSFPVEWHIGPQHKFGLRLVLFRLFQGILIFSMIWIAVRAIDFIGMVFMSRAKRTESKSDDQLVPFAKEAIKVIVAAIGFLILIGVVFNLDIVSLVTGLGIGGLAFALAAKETLENLLGSFTIFLDKPFVVGDTVKVGIVEGKVESIGFRSTRIRAVDRMIVIVPNKKMTDAELINDTERASRRSFFTVALSNQTTEVQMRAIITEIRRMLTNFTLIEPNPTVRFKQVNTSSFDITVAFFVLSPDMDEYLAIQEEVNFEILKIMKANNATFATPTSTVYYKGDSVTSAIE